MMTEPFGNTPKISLKNIQDGYVTRYFLRHVSRRDVLEVDKKQYDIFSRNAFYETFSLKWFILGSNAMAKNMASINLYTSTPITENTTTMLNALRKTLKAGDYVVDRTDVPTPPVGEPNDVFVSPARGNFTPPNTGGTQQRNN